MGCFHFPEWESPSYSFHLAKNSIWGSDVFCKNYTFTSVFSSNKTAFLDKECFAKMFPTSAQSLLFQAQLYISISDKETKPWTPDFCDSLKCCKVEWISEMLLHWKTAICCEDTAFSCTSNYALAGEIFHLIKQDVLIESIENALLQQKWSPLFHLKSSLWEKKVNKKALKWPWNQL